MRLSRLAPLWPPLWIAAVFAATLPWAVTYPAPGLDSSWDIALRLAVDRREQFGTQFAFTYGPLGMLHDPLYVSYGTWLASLAGRLVVELAFCAAIGLLLRQVSARWWEWLAVGLLMVLSETLPYEADGAALTAGALFLAMAVTAEGRWQATGQALAGGSVLAIACLVKGSSVDGAAIVFAVFLFAMAAWRRPLVAAGAALLSFAVLFLAVWLAAGQGFGNLVPYVRTSVQFVSGYTAAMAVPPKRTALYVPAQVGLAASALVVTSLLALAGLAVRDRRLFVLNAMVAPLLLLSFKETFVRFGDRQVGFFLATALLEAPVAVALWRGLEPRLNPLALLPGLMAVAMLVGSVGAVTVAGVPYAWGSPLDNVTARWASYGPATRLANPAYRAAQKAATRARLRRAFPVEPRLLAEIGSGSVDVMPFDTSLPYAYGLKWAHRPVIQSYADYTPQLDQLTASHFEGARAPDFVLVAEGAIDGDYMPFVEPVTFRTLAAQYEYADRGAAYLLLRRRPAVSCPLTPLATRTAPLGAWVGVPAGPPGQRVYAAVTIPYSLKGTLMNLGFQASALHVSLRQPAGTVTYHLVRNNTAEGLDLSGYVQPGDLDSLRDLLAGKSRGRITAVRFTAEHPSDYRPEVEISFLSQAVPGGGGTGCGGLAATSGGSAAATRPA